MSRGKMGSFLSDDFYFICKEGKVIIEGKEGGRANQEFDQWRENSLTLFLLAHHPFTFLIILFSIGNHPPPNLWI